MIIAMCLEERSRGAEAARGRLGDRFDGLVSLRGIVGRTWHREDGPVRMSDPSPSANKSSDWTSAYHAPVLATDVARLLGSSRSALDGTLGGGGHAYALLAAGVNMVV